MIRIRGSILFGKLFGLMALQIAMLLGWRTYDVYQNKILLSLQYGSLGDFFLLLQGLLAIVIEPLMGAYSDRILAKNGSRFLSIVLGVTVAGLIFVASAVVFRSEPGPLLRGLVPLLMALWIAAMTSFRSPAASLLYRYTASQTLPMAVALLVMVNGIMGALGYYLNQMILGLGVSLAFGLAGVVLGIGVLILRFVSKEEKPTEPPPREPISSSLLAYIFGMGFGVGVSLNLLLVASPGLLLKGLGGLDLEAIKAILLLISALLCIPAAILAMLWSVKKLLFVGVSLLFVVLGVVLLGGAFGGWLFLVLLGILLGVVLNSLFPFVLSIVPGTRAGLGSGVLFSGLGASFLVYSLLSRALSLASLSGVALLFASSVLVILCAEKSAPGERPN